MLLRGVVCLLLASLTADPYAEATPGYESITAANMRAHLRLLASETMQGRETATPQLEIAGDYAASIFALSGIEPAGESVGEGDKRTRTYFQTFEVAEV